MRVRSLMWLLAAAVAAPALVSAQGVPPTQQQKKERALAAELDVDAVELVALEKEMGHAKLLNNPSFFQRVYSDDYHGTNATGEILDKNAVVARIQSSGIKYYTFVVSDIAVRVYGASAVVTCTWSARGEQGGHDFARQYRVIHVYINNKAGGWKVVASQETMLAG
ncbi:MAG TPA: nuclear transport factor 2 family protein [Candidatus Acidoferrum sp.]|nr:nuclear transport factor 2 family protein [Candidatus Acidoferrum sp.]